MGACGGRSKLQVLNEAHDGGGLDGSAGTVRADGAPIDTLAHADGAAADVTDRGDVMFPDARRDVSASDVPSGDSAETARDVPATTDGRTDGPTTTARDGAPDAVVATLSSIEISPAAPTVHIGTPLSAVITAVYSDSSTKDVSSTSSVVSSAASIVTVSGTTLTGVATGTATITATYQGKTATTPVTVVASPLQSIGIGSVGTINVGQEVNLVATGVFADGSKQNVTAQANWTSSNVTIASIGNASATEGQLTGVAAGTVTVTASIGTIMGTVQVSVTSSPIAAIQITPTLPTLQQGVTQAFQATATYANGTSGDVTQQATWATGSTGVVTVVATGATAGLATAQGAGTTTITATLGTVSGTTSVTVISTVLTSITVTPATATIMVGTTRTFTAQGTYQDGTTANLTDSVTWSSGSATVLSVSNATGTQGLATALAAGTANVQAVFLGVTGSAAVTVSAAPLISISVTPNTLNVPLGITSPLKATGTYGVAGDPATQTTQDVTTAATWTVQNNSIATVGNSSTTAGEVTAVAVGSTTVIASLSGFTGSATVTVNTATLLTISVLPATASVSAGNTQAFTATGNYDNNTTTDLTTMATWSSSNTAVAQESNAAGSNGLATSLTQGTATITASYNGVQGSTPLSVTSPNLVSITIAPTAATIKAGATQTYTVTGVFKNGTTSTSLTGVTWSSSSTAVATIAAGGGLVFPGAPAVGATATGVAAGTATITATYATAGGASFSATATLTVTAASVATPTAIRITPATASIAVNGTQTYAVYEDFSDGTNTTLTTGVTLTTSDGTIAAVTTVGLPGGPGGFGGILQVTGEGAGTATITATYTTGGATFTATATLTVTAAIASPTQVGLYISPGTASVAVNGTQQFSAHATYSDGTSKDVTNSTDTSWTTSDGTLATVTNAAAGGGRGAVFGGGTGGLATGLAAGTPTINASYGGFSATASLTVTSAVSNPQVGLYITPGAASVKVNGTQQFQAFATYTDGTAVAVTNDANTSWGTSNATLATITTPGSAAGPGAIFGGGAGGLATGLAAGTLTINASYGGFSATATLTVTSVPTLIGLVITPATATIHVGQDQAFVATAEYSDGSTATVTTSATWTTSDASIAVMSAMGGAGRGGPVAVVGGATATGLGVGSATVSASYTESGVTKTGSAALTVTAPTLLSLEITPTTPTVYLSTSPTQAFVATAIYTDYSTATVTASADWSSSNGAIAVISNTGATTGRATGLAAGTSTITAAFNGMSASTTLTVASAKPTKVQVTPTNPTAHLGINQSFVAVVLLDNSTTQTVTGSATWTSSDVTVATVGATGASAGVATPIKAGTTTITATYQGLAGTAVLAVSGAALSSIAITPTPLGVVVGGHQQLIATGTWSDSTTADITNSVTWLSSSDAIATVSNASGSRGLFTAVTAGAVTVTAEFQSVKGTLAGTVTASQ